MTLEAQSISKSYGIGASAERVLMDISLHIAAGEACVLLGPSGSGKTTLLSILGCMLTPNGGELRLQGKAVEFHDVRSLTELRRRNLGFVFQHSQLLPFLSVRDNLRLVGRNAGMDDDEVDRRMILLIDRLGLRAVHNKKPGQLSGGQRQRAAIARAVLHRPPVLLADEPTASLDWNAGESVADLLIEQSRCNNCALLVVTHDTRLLPKFDRIFYIHEGSLSETLQKDP